ncbi:MAG TPA: ATP-binding protein, partial [Phaeodactylibacter sp.]|nr:ATP-binding protein [Phaeodactylibacter sp.]
FEIKKEKINVNELLREIIQSVEIKVTQLGGKITTHLRSQQSDILADKLHLTNIIHNLLDNAIKYCKDTPDITIETANINGHLEIKITDKGIGIEKEFQPKIFQKFYRVPTGNVHNVKGFGLGLFYVKNICQAHGWKITAKSEENKGTQITLTTNALQ